VSAEEADLARCHREPLHGFDERLEVVAAPPHRRALVQRLHLPHPGGVVDPDHLLEPLPQVTHVELVREEVLGDGAAGGVDRHPAMAAVPGQVDEPGPVVPAGELVLVVEA
jgi:hypothetical protein